MYVINVHGLNKNNLNDDGTEKKFKVITEIDGLFSRNPIMATIVSRMNTEILI
jgi:hypothetical protein